MSVDNQIIPYLNFQLFHDLPLINIDYKCKVFTNLIFVADCMNIMSVQHYQKKQSKVYSKAHSYVVLFLQHVNIKTTGIEFVCLYYKEH